MEGGKKRGRPPKKGVKAPVTDDEMSSKEEDKLEEEGFPEYYSTNLAVSKNLTLADFEVEIFDELAFNIKLTEVQANCSRPGVFSRVIDPNEVYKAKMMEGQLQTLVPYEMIPALCLQAFELYKRFQEQDIFNQGQEEEKSAVDIEQLQTLINQQHSVVPQAQELRWDLSKYRPFPRRLIKRQEKARKLQNDRELLKQEVIRLYKEKQVSKLNLKRRLKVTDYFINKALVESEQQSTPYKRPSTGRYRFKKLHRRAQHKIKEFIESSAEPITAPRAQKMLKEEANLRVSKKLLSQYFKEKLGLRYKKLNTISYAPNSLQSRLRRQYAAAEYIQHLHSGTHIINIDESVFDKTDSRDRGWWFPVDRIHQTRVERLSALNFIAAITSQGHFYYTVNHGKTNSNTYFNFILKLIAHLDSQDQNWRSTTVFLLDNASYHKSRDTLDRYYTCKVPVLFLGPYHFKLAPIELMFSYIKNRNLNTLFSKVSSKQELLVFTSYQALKAYLHEGGGYVLEQIRHKNHQRLVQALPSNSSE